MARALSQVQRAELAAFLRALYQAGGWATQVEWVKASGYSGPNLSYALSGKRGIDGYNLWRLIRSTAERLGREPLEVAAEAGRSPDGHLEELAEQVETLADTLALVNRTLEGLQADQQAVVSQLKTLVADRQSGESPQRERAPRKRSSRTGEK